MVRRYVLTGAPGSGKTTVLRRLQRLGWAVVEEAATDVIARAQQRAIDAPWQQADFVDAIVAQQQRRRLRPVDPGTRVQFHDRSPLCTLALAHWLGQAVTPLLADEIARITEQRLYQRRVFLIRPLGFVEPTAARRISYPESLRFERVHEAVYREHGFEIVDVARGDPSDRAAAIAAAVTEEAEPPAR